MLRHWREKEFEKHLPPQRHALRASGSGPCSPSARRSISMATRLAARVLHNQGHGKGRLSSLPLASGWTQYRDFPAPQGKTFQQMWKERRT